MKIAFAMAMGPGEAEMVIENMESICAMYPDAEIWVRDDATTDGTWERVEEWSRGKNVRLSRNASANGYYWISRTHGELLLGIVPSKPDLLIKLDPDTFLIRPGLEKLFLERFAQYGPGICGSYRTSPNGETRSFRYHGLMVALDALPIGPERKRKELRWRPVGYSPYIFRAMRHGYLLGEHVQGGLFAMDGGTLQGLADSGLIKAMAYGRRGLVGTEDVVLTLGVKALGGAISPLNQEGAPRPTHIQAVHPLDIGEEHLYDPRLLAVHPVKKQEIELRATLRSLRDGAALENSSSQAATAGESS